MINGLSEMLQSVRLANKMLTTPNSIAKWYIFMDSTTEEKEALLYDISVSL